jgi:hypothetical protein
MEICDGLVLWHLGESGVLHLNIRYANGGLIQTSALQVDKTLFYKLSGGYMGKNNLACKTGSFSRTYKHLQVTL